MSGVYTIKASMIALSQNAGNPNDYSYVRRDDYDRDLAEAEVDMMRLISRAIADGHRGNGSAEDDICCQVCQEIECDDDCAVALSATLTAQRDAARDIAARLEGELARVRSVVLGLDHYRECPGAYGAYNACDCGHSDLMEATGGEVLTGSALRTPWPHPDAVIAEGES